MRQKKHIKQIIVSEYANLLIEMDEVVEAKKVYNTEINRLKNIKNPSDIEKY